MTDASTGEVKSVLVLARRDQAEAMRVAAGLTIFGHRVRLVFMDRPLEENAETTEQAELLELADIMPETTVADELLPLPHVSISALVDAIMASDAVMSL